MESPSEEREEKRELERERKRGKEEDRALVWQMLTERVRKERRDKEIRNETRGKMIE